MYETLTEVIMNQLLILWFNQIIWTEQCALWIHMYATHIQVVVVVHNSSTYLYSETMEQ